MIKKNNYKSQIRNIFPNSKSSRPIFEIHIFNSIHQVQFHISYNRVASNFFEKKSSTIQEQLKDFSSTFLTRNIPIHHKI